LAENATVLTRGIDVAAELPALLPDPVIGCDATGTVVYWNRAAEETYGYGAAEALGQHPASLLHTRFPAPLLEITEELSDLGQWQGRLEHRCRDGRTVAVHSRWVARRDDRGARLGSFAIDRVLAAEAAAPVARASEAGGSLDAAATTPASSAALAHELNNALAIIINYSAFVADELESPGDAPSEEARRSMRADLDQIQAAAERALELLRQLPG
jgi:PAS domain S-box-containing protein